MSEAKKCPKCNGEMRIGYLSNAWRWTEGKNPWSMPRSKAYAYACQNCGFIEFYLEQKANEGKGQIRQVGEDQGRDRLVRT
jgi:predicted nucleic-acid-binding Zn-ribbon protein